MQSIKTGDIEICYDQKGSGPPVVMIMGLTANMDWWSPDIIEGLSDDFSLLLFDNRGAGRTTTGLVSFSIKQFAADTVRLMRAVGIERAHVVGVSMGGMIAQELSLGWPGMVDRLVLCCTTCGGIHSRPPTAQALKVLLGPRSTDAAEQAVRSLPILFPEPWLSTHPELAGQFAETVGKAPISLKNARLQIRAVTRFDTYRRLPGITQQTLVMCGAEDVLIPPVNSDIIARRIPGAKLRVLEGAGHGFTTQCGPEVAAEIKQFLSGEPANA